MRHLPKLLAAISMVVAAFTGPSALAATLHVPADYPTIQSCIDAAVSGQDECVVAPGTYNELINFLGKAITLRSSHGPQATILYSSDPTIYLVSCTSNETSTTFLTGFTIRNGLIRNNTGTPTIHDCIFINVGILNHYGGDYGVVSIFDSYFYLSRIYCYYSGTSITRCIFDNSSASRFISNDASSLYADKCVFIRSRGGAIYNNGDEHYAPGQWISNSLFIGNRGDRGGAFYNLRAWPRIRNCTFTENNAFDSGGAIYTSVDGGGTSRGSIFWNDSPNEFSNFNEIGAWFSNIQGWPGGTQRGMIYKDPLFVRAPSPGPDGSWDGVDDDYGDLRLQPGSPCINAGIRTTFRRPARPTSMATRGCSADAWIWGRTSSGSVILIVTRS